MSKKSKRTQKSRKGKQNKKQPSKKPTKSARNKQLDDMLKYEEAMSEFYARQEVVNTYGAGNIIFAPAELGLPADSVIVTNYASQSGYQARMYPYAAYIPDLKKYVPAREQKRILYNLQKQSEKYDCIRLRNNEFHYFAEESLARKKELPPPFYHEPLMGFTIELERGEFNRVEKIDFVPSVCKPISDQAIVRGIPKVDFLIDSYDKVSGSIFLVRLQSKNAYGVAYCFYQDVAEEVLDVYSVLVHSYFIGQLAFYMCKEHIVEYGTEEIVERPSANKSPITTKGKKGLNTVKIRHTIRLGEPAPPKREINRHTDCWYQRGCMVHRKNGTTYFRKGCYKGPKRNDPDARKRTKRYITDKDIEKDCD